jgi:hypothetical protein
MKSQVVTPNNRAARRARQSNRIGYRVNEWSAMTGTSRVTTWRNIRNGTLKTVNYAGITLILHSELARLGFEEA